ncbi:bifunctional (p)ppGpp synthetase/guanosine-3',5'-bis(diphosphate) 3'-pyrophosphohydrolase, partial [Candidatus Daviesbacteria bacterium]|nr:bifunctional (p)ppGpp synthetase/guanosine-3',5'-bis(diphosphate) 3'-pyrophosphohydrolase [Candidatus Daviesbacteria bacterium]
LEKLGKVLLKIKGEITLSLKKNGINAELQSRVKHIYSLYTKLTRPEINKDLNKIHDLIALRIIVESTEACYQVLDLVHKLFRSFPEPVSDYIAHPKPNGYQSIHTRVFGPNDLVFEIQIRTREMHDKAEYGLAAHWNYSEQKEKEKSDEKISQGFATSAEKLEWVKNLAMWQKEVTDNNEFLKTVKTDLFGQRIFCFTPKGDVKDLPNGATPIDFAYLVHTNMGNLVTGVKINGKVISLDTKLKNGDVVELSLSKDQKKKPSRDWLNFVVTSLAKNKIKKACQGST